MLYSFIGVLVIALDQFVKYLAVQNLGTMDSSVALIPNILSLVCVQNGSVNFGLFQGRIAKIWFIALTVSFVILVVLVLASNRLYGSFGRWCLIFIAVGGFSNMIDRVCLGYVIDVLQFFSVTLNVADIMIAFFCIAFIVYSFFCRDRHRSSEPDTLMANDEDAETAPHGNRKQAASVSKFDVVPESSSVRVPPQRKEISAPVKHSQEKPAVQSLSKAKEFDLDSILTEFKK